MGRIQADRQQQGPDFAVEVSLHPAPLGFVALTMREQAYALSAQRWQEHLVVEAVLFLNHRTGTIGDTLQARNVCAAARRLCRFDVWRHPDFKKFVEVG